MADLTIIYWRDIPAQVVAKQGRRSAKRELPPRFAEAIDMAAMRSGARDDQSYLDEWRRGEPTPCGEDLDEAADAALARLDAEYDRERLAALVSAGGRQA
jgi:Virulence factor